MRKISSIDSRGKILFVDDKGTGTTTGTKADCEAYGYDFKNNVCKIPTSRQQLNQTHNFTYGRNNKVSGVNNTTLGYSNIINGSNSISIGNNNITDVYADNSIALGKNVYTEHIGELSYSASKTPNRAKFSILQYDGVTTNNTATELFLGGNNGARFYVNESCESAYYIESKLVVLDGTNNNAFFITHYLLYKYANNTLTEVIEVPLLNQGDSALNSVSVAYAPVSSTPDYIEVKVTGLASTRLEYNLILQVTEVKNV